MKPGEELDQLDPRKSNYVMVIGRKGSGKSHWTNNVVADWPGKRLVIDVTGDVGPELRRLGVEPVAVRKIPSKWPVDDEGKPVDVVTWRPDSGASSFLVDIDEAFQLAWKTGDVAVHVDEVMTCCPPEARTKQPAVRRVLVEGRHRGISLFACGPRPVWVDRLWLQQADAVIMFRTPSVDDRRLVIDAMGFDRAEVEALHSSMDEHGYLWLDVKNETCTQYPPLPKRGRAPIPHHPTERHQ